MLVFATESGFRVAETCNANSAHSKLLFRLLCLKIIAPRRDTHDEIPVLNMRHSIFTHSGLTLNATEAGISLVDTEARPRTAISDEYFRSFEAIKNVESAFRLY